MIVWWFVCCIYVWGHVRADRVALLILLPCQLCVILKMYIEYTTLIVAYIVNAIGCA